VTGGAYLRWVSGCGAELWLQAADDGDVIGMNPHFDAHSSVRVRLSARVCRPGETALDGAFHGWADPQEDEPECGAYPFVFDSPDFARYAELDLPSVQTAHVVAFAHEIQAFESPEAFDRSQPEERKFASQFFIPSGLFQPGGGETDPPAALAVFAGHVLQADRRTNPATGRDFYWALVASHGGSYDVVADPSLLEEPPVVGGVIQGQFWLSGRLAGDWRPWRRGWLDRLRGR
jgi:hypothetical protein